jgi:hypothetical protein
VRGNSFELRFPRDLTEKHLAQVLAAVQALPAAGPGRLLAPGEAVILDTVGTEAGVSHFLSVSETFTPVVASSIRAAHGSVRLDRQAVPAVPAGTVVRALEFGRTGTNEWRSKELGAIAASLLAALQPVETGAQLRIQLVLAPAVWLETGELSGLWQVLSGSRPRKPTKAPPSRMLVCLRVLAAASSEQRAWSLLRRVRAVVASLRQGGSGLRTRHLPAGRVARRLTAGVVPRWWPMTATHQEVATLVAWPLEAPTLGGVSLHGTRILPVPALLPAKGRVIGRALAEGENARPVAMSWAAAPRHSLVLAPTGSGKTTWLAGLVLQSVAAGRSVVLIDPKLDLVTAVAERLPDEALDRTIIVDPGLDPVVGFNPLASAANAELVVDQVTGLFANLFASGWGPRSEDLLRHVLRTIAASGQLSIIEAALLLSSDSYRAGVLSRLDDPIGLGEFWSHFASLSATEQRQVIAPLSNKLRAFSSRPHLRHVLGQLEPGWSLPDAMNSGGIVLVSLDRAGMGQEAARLFGALVLSEVWQATLGRGAIDRSLWHPLDLVVDELPELVGVPAHFEEFLAQARSFGVGLTAALQSFSQVPPALRQALLGARTRLAFAPSAEDARILASEFRPHLRADDLLGLGGYELAGMVATDDGSTVPVTVATTPLPPAVRSYASVARLSAERFGRPRDAIEAELRARRQPTGDAPLGRVRRSP